MDSNTNVRTTIVPLGGSTAILEIGGLRLITDPAFDPPAENGGGPAHRTSSPAHATADLDGLDVALVSHDQHPDNLDAAGRALLERLPLVLTTEAGAQRLGGTARGLVPFEHTDVDRPDGGRLRITALPAQHGPAGADDVLGPVIGFLLTADDIGPVYVSGDNASVEIVEQIAQRVGPVEVALLFAGGARIPAYFDGAPLTLTASAAVEAARALSARAVVPMHCEGWSHYAEDTSAFVEAFAAAGLGDRLAVVPAGASVQL